MQHSLSAQLPHFQVQSVAEAMLDGKPESLFMRTLKNYPRSVMWNKALKDEKGFDKASETERNSMQTNSAKAQLSERAQQHEIKP